MAQDARQIRVLAAGDVYLGPTTADAPTDSTTPLDSDFVKYGLIDTAGPRITPGSESFNIDSWQTAFPVFVGVSTRTEEISFNLLQLTEEAISLAHGGGSWSGASGDRSYTAAAAGAVDHRSLVIEGTDGTHTLRVYFPIVLVTSVGEIAFTRTGAAMLSLTLAATQISADQQIANWFHDFTDMSLS